jgi:hypothetical protein
MPEDMAVWIYPLAGRDGSQTVTLFHTEATRTATAQRARTEASEYTGGGEATSAELIHSSERNSLPMGRNKNMRCK